MSDQDRQIFATAESRIVVEKRLTSDHDVKYPICMDGQLEFPPEDCAGVPGFYDLLDVINNPDNEGDEEMRDWIGADFDPWLFPSTALLGYSHLCTADPHR
jgi:hypothetical protein